MADLLALLDAAIKQLQTVDSSRCSRSHPDTESRTGTGNPLNEKAVPVVPVVPIQKQDRRGPISNAADAECKHGQAGRAREYPSKELVTTGTTGTDEAFCGSLVPMRIKQNGNEREHASRETGSTERQLQSSAYPAAIWGNIGEGGAVISTPLLLRDGRRMWRFSAHHIPSSPLVADAPLVAQARQHRVVLVADDRTLVVVEPWRSDLPVETLRQLRKRAGGIITMLRSEHRFRHPTPGWKGGS